MNSRAEPLSVLTGVDKRLNHHGLDEVTVELIQFGQPEVVAIEVSVRRSIRIDPIEAVFYLRKPQTLNEFTGRTSVCTHRS